jgi:two-component system response regulator RegX3
VRVLLVEDDDAIADPLVEGLEREGFEVERVATGAAALAAEQPDIVLLDLGLPDMDGFTVCHDLRQRSSVPIVAVTARSAEVNRVVGLDLGADDYLVKPFGFRELVARMRAVLRRTGTGTNGAATTAPAGVEGLQTLGQLRIDRRTHRVHVGEREVALTPKEFDLLGVLARDPGAVVPRQEILEAVWDPHWYGPTKTLDVHVASLRRKLGDPAWVETVRGVGFRLGSPPGEPGFRPGSPPGEAGSGPGDPPAP